ncbi:DUF4430 domain-containing protein [Promicromonospora sp. CA-289599]|uniref:DUF4430 domain-containing protein n=1 Tax=Promicromonospora sp. CA-289599 TaxID=3240014 RepID=UPI003D90F16E
MTSVRPLRALGAAAAALLLTGLLAACGGDAAGRDPVVPATLSAQSDAASPSADAETLSYAGRTGATALELLLAADPSAEVTGEGENAFVTGIGGRVADDSKKEFWSLSVDGEPAQVGAGTLETEDGQEITWTIETY